MAADQADKGGSSSKQASSELLLETIVSYFPTLVSQRFVADTQPLKSAEATFVSAAVLFADISGFTSLTEQVAVDGPKGAEVLSTLLNAYFDPLINLILSHGGDVVTFAGDGLMALWPSVAGETLDVAVLRAMQCGLEIQRELHGFLVAPTVRLSLRVGIAGGDIGVSHVGGAYDRWELLIVGEPLVQMARAEQAARPGDVVLSTSILPLVANNVIGEPLSADQIRLISLRRPIAPCRATPPLVSAHAAGALLSYLPAAIRTRLMAGQTEWLAELRRVTVIFVNLPDWGQATQAGLSSTQLIMSTMQLALDRYEGSINKLSVDDKGITLVAALGLPPLAHEDDPVRAVQAALSIQSKLRELRVRSSIGVATGRVFCGSVGNAARREYTMIGAPINLAARLMQAAPGDVLCDASTYRASRDRVRFEPLPSIQVKGQSHPVEVYRPFSQASTMSNNRPVFGRDSELTVLTGSLGRLAEGHGATILVSGEPGIGKSRFVDEFLSHAGGRPLVGLADAIDKSTPYYAWRSVFDQIFDLQDQIDVDGRRRYVLEQLRADMLQRAPLLNSVLPLELPENALTAQMTGQVRADNTRDLLTALLATEAARSPLILYLDDVQWLDSASWALACAVSRSVTPLLMIMTSRSQLDQLPDDARELRNTPGFRTLALLRLPESNVSELLCERLGVSGIQPQVLDFINDKAHGNPFFSEELAYALRDAGLIVVDAPTCHLAVNVDLRSVAFPDSIQSVITARIDGLSPAQQLSLKVASVVGRVFAYPLLHHIYPVDSDRPHLGEYLSELEGLELTSAHVAGAEIAYIFKHVITQEVAYNLMLFGQRSRLHRVIAEWYEATFAHELSTFYPLLAHHWQLAADTEKAIEYLDKAGEFSLRSGAYQEAVTFFRDAIRLDTECRDSLRQARWERSVAEAHYGLGELQQSFAHLNAALSLLGCSPPTTSRGLRLDILAQVCVQLARRTVSTHTAAATSVDAAAGLEASRAYELLGTLHFLESRSLEALDSSLRTLNYAEIAGPSPQLARAYASVSLAAGLASLQGVQRSYAQRGLATATKIDHGSAHAFVQQVSSLYHAGQGRWTEAHRGLEAALTHYERLADRRRCIECVCLLSTVTHYQGNFGQRLAMGERVSLMAQDSGDAQARAWGLLDRIESLLPLGRLDEARTLLTDVLGYVDNIGRVDQIWTYGLRARAYLYLHDLSEARHSAEAAAQLMLDASPIAVYTLEGYTGVAETFLALWERSRSAGADDPGVRAAAWRACRHLSAFASIYKVGRPRAELSRGLAHWLAGHGWRAQRAWHRSAEAGRLLNMPYEQARTHFEIGRHHPLGDAQRLAHLEKARGIFTDLQATYDLSRTEAEIGMRLSSM